MPQISDREFGAISVRHSARSRRATIKVAPNGSLRATVPYITPLFMVRRLIASSREELRTLIERAHPVVQYKNNMTIGKSHTLVVQAAETLRVTKNTLRIIVSLPDSLSLDDSIVQSQLRPVVIAALRREAKSYLPKRLAYLAAQYGFQFDRVRISHASSRWGSCSSTGTISLNLALMKLPFELIDYVLIHELAHTRHMNHSKEFWALVAGFDADYREHRRRLKEESPHI